MSKGFDTRKLMTGKDGKLYITVDGRSYWYASIEEFEIKANFNNTDFHPAGDVQEYAVPTGVKFMLSFTEAVIRDDYVLVPILESVKKGKIPSFDFQGASEEPFSGGQQKFLCNECIPDGDTDILSVKSGEIIKRQMGFVINSVPDCIKALV